MDEHGAENCARNYWETYPILKKNEQILILGFENYGQKILSQALLKNVVALDSEIEYHIAGDYQEYLSRHIKLHKVAHLKRVGADGTAEDIMPYDPICTNHDSIYFYDMEWYEILRRDISFDRIIIVDDIDAANIDIPFNYAKLIHARYYASWQCDGKCGGRECGNRADGRSRCLRECIRCERFLDDWSKLSTFLRYSNVAQADHISEKLRLLLGKDAHIGSHGVGARAMEAYKRLDWEEKKVLWEIEHIRWDRYHFMNNWDYAKERDDQNRKHPLLIPFSELSDQEQGKDEDAYLALNELLD